MDLINIIVSISSIIVNFIIVFIEIKDKIKDKEIKIWYQLTGRGWIEVKSGKRLHYGYKKISNKSKNKIKYNKERFTNSYVTELLEKKTDKVMRIIIIMTFLIFLYNGIYLINKDVIKVELLFFLNILSIAIFIYQITFNYRVKRGYYGTNYEEAKELLYFIKKSNNDNNIDKGKKILNEVNDFKFKNEGEKEYI